jgi:hypothetical protein
MSGGVPLTTGMGPFVDCPPESPGKEILVVRDGGR